MTNELIELETKIAYLENSLNELSDVVYQQQQTIDQLNKMVKALEDRAVTESAKLIETNEKPPHY